MCNPSFVFTVLLLISANGRIAEQKAEIANQTSFSSESPFERPVALGEAAKIALASDREIAGELNDARLSVQSIPKGWFRASEVQLGPANEAGLVVMALNFSPGPNRAYFWILRSTPKGYEIVLATDAHDLSILEGSSNGLRDIQTALPSGAPRPIKKYEFDGLLYEECPPLQGDQPSKIPTGEAQFTPEQLKDYYLVYKNPDVKYLRTLFDAYLKDSGAINREFNLLDKWNKDYYRSKFVVLSRDGNMFGGTFITILFQDRSDRIFIAWVYPEGSERKLTLKGFDLGNFTVEDIRRTRIRYKELIEDKKHSM